VFLLRVKQVPTKWSTREAKKGRINNKTQSRRLLRSLEMEQKVGEKSPNLVKKGNPILKNDLARESNKAGNCTARKFAWKGKEARERATWACLFDKQKLRPTS